MEEVSTLHYQYDKQIKECPNCGTHVSKAKTDEIRELSFMDEKNNNMERVAVCICTYVWIVDRFSTLGNYVI